MEPLTRRIPITAFSLVSTPAGAYASPDEVDFTDALPACAPGTVAEALARAGRLDLAHPPPLDAQDHWFRGHLPADLPATSGVLVGEGLATLTDVWVDGVARAGSRSMFAPHEVALDGLRGGEALVLCFRALTGELAKRRPRPRWRTRLVDAQQLRYVRTSLLGRMPGLGPAVPPIGPYGPVYLALAGGVRVREARLFPDAAARVLRAEIALAARDEAAAQVDAELRVHGAAGTGTARLHVHRDGAVVTLRGEVPIADLALWWPHTHGAQPLSEVTLALAGHAPESLGQVGFRTLTIDRGDDGQGFGLRINDVPVFARGACFLTSDFLGLGEAGLAALLEHARRAGMNMLRVPGIAAYPPPAFHRLCDTLGILVFQDFMFANMDYPAGDPDFDAAVEAEVRALLVRTGPSPSTAVLCGGSEVAQQVAMLGFGEERWRSALFDARLPALAEALAPFAAYVAHSPSGGALPFHVDAGLAHYYGVGAYLRPFDDLRRSRVRFASECLAFANAPCTETIERFMRDLEMPFHHPRWKERVPRDRGVGWDFEDVRDHYVATLFAVDPRMLRAQDPERYLALGHAAVGACIEAAFSEWRRAGADCRGALLFWLQDLWAGAGFGLIDADGLPKSAYHHAARAFRSPFLGLTDEGLNGLAAHVVNEQAAPLDASLHVALYRDGELLVVEGGRALHVPARGALSLPVDALLPRFADATYAYRFGPPPHDLVVATLHRGDEVLARAHHLPLGRARARAELGLVGTLGAAEGGAWLSVTSRAFAQHVRIDVPGYLPEDDFFHLAPGETRRVWLAARSERAGPPRGTVDALNARSPSALLPAPPVAPAASAPAGR
ncbi:MAG: glycoside hydrolase family 2 protein [Polyangiales bacterium]